MNGATEQHDLREWIADWQAGDQPARAEDSIRQYVERRTRTLRIWTVVDVTIGCGFLVFLLHRTITHPDPVEKVAMGLLSLITLGTLAYGLWNWRGLRTTSMQTTNAFVTLSLDRAVRMRRAIRAGWLVLLAEVTVFVPWVWYRLYGEGSPSPAAERFGWGFLAGMTGLAIIFLLSLSAWAARDQRRFAELQKEIDD